MERGNMRGTWKWNQELKEEVYKVNDLQNGIRTINEDLKRFQIPYEYIVVCRHGRSSVDVKHLVTETNTSDRNQDMNQDMNQVMNQVITGSPKTCMNVVNAHVYNLLIQALESRN